jgi:hypothetical protein
MTLNRLAWLVGVAVLVLVVNVAISILYMVVYGHLIDPGHDDQYYHDHIQVAAPYCSIVAGIPLMFLAGWWVSGWWEREVAVQAALVVWLAYVLIDIAVLLASVPTMKVEVLFTMKATILFTISFATKLVSVYLGALFGNRLA